MLARLFPPALVLLLASTLAAAERPNLLIVMADDCTWNDLAVYGGQNAKTPHLDAFAAQGTVFEKAFLCSAICQPCRAELYTGQYPLRNGCAWNHSACRPDVLSLPDHLRPLGYRVGIAGKVHVLPKEAFPFDPVAGFDSNCVRNPTQPHNVHPVQRYMTDGADPFCLVVCLVEPHVPWVMGDPSQYPRKKIQLPPNIADTPRTRADYARYLAEITYMDQQVGEILQALEASGKADDTLVLFTSEQGAQFPGCKWTNWQTGVHTALIARWPGHVAAGARNSALVQYADVVPTFVEVAGGEVNSEQFDGTSFLPVLLGDETQHRDYVYGLHNNIPEGPAYPIRSVTDGEFHYIRNLTPEEIYIEKHLMGIQGAGGLNNPYWATWVWDAAETPHTYDLVKRYTRRPPEQLYRLSQDAYELDNLADDPAYADVKQRLSQELDQWMQAQGDPGVPEDTLKAVRAARRGEHLYGPSAE